MKSIFSLLLFEWKWLERKTWKKTKISCKEKLKEEQSIRIWDPQCDASFILLLLSYRWQCSWQQSESFWLSFQVGLAVCIRTNAIIIACSMENACKTGLQYYKNNATQAVSNELIWWSYFQVNFIRSFAGYKINFNNGLHVVP